MYVAYCGGVSCLRVVLQHPGQTEVRHFTHQVVIHKNISCCQVPVDIADVGQVHHTGGNATQHTNQLDHGEVPVMLLQKARRGAKGWKKKRVGDVYILSQ